MTMSALAATVRVQIPAKINLALAVGPRRADGFHDLATIFHAIDLVDSLEAEANSDGLITVTTTGDEAGQVPNDETNLAVRAAAALRERHGTPELGVRLRIRKRIPVAGGMAGGSADGAGALLACNAIWQLGCTRDELLTMAAELGSDMPFSLLGGNALGTGRGERLTALPARLALKWVIAVAEGGLSTPLIYRTFDQLAEAGRLVPSAAHPDALIAALTSGGVEDVAGLLANALQAPAIECYPALQETLQTGCQAGAMAGLVSGSGPSCVFLVSDQASATQVMAALSGLPQVRAVLQANGPVPGPELESIPIDQER